MNAIKYFGTTDPGLLRNKNEDTFFVETIWDESCLLAIVIDGVGGYEGGEVAAAIARDSIVEYVCGGHRNSCLDLLGRAVLHANNRIFLERQQNPGYSSMSCVLTAVIVDRSGGVLHMAHVGDTRLYKFFSDGLEKLSRDHSLVGYREEIGDLSEEEAMAHPMRNVISRDVGSLLLETGEDYMELKSFPLQDGSLLLLCSDGLCDMVMSGRISEILSMRGSVKDKVDALIEEAKKMGGKDNITVVLVEL